LERGDRKIIFGKEYTKCGIATGSHKEYSIMHVLDFAIGYRSKEEIGKTKGLNYQEIANSTL